MQYLMTAGIAVGSGTREQNIIHTNMLFALALDRWVFGTVLGWWSLGGSALILGSAVWVALQKDPAGEGGEGAPKARDVEVAQREEMGGLLGSVDGGEEGEEAQLRDFRS